MFDFDDLEVLPAAKAPAPAPSSSAQSQRSLGLHDGSNGASAAADAAIARLKQAAWAAEEAARPPPPPPPPAEEEEVLDVPAPQQPAAEAEAPKAPAPKPRGPGRSHEERRALLDARARERAEAAERAQQQLGGSEPGDRYESVIVGSALYGRSAYDVPWRDEQPPAKVRDVDDGESDREEEPGGFGGPVANAVAYAKQMRAERAARSKAAREAKEEEEKEAEPEVPYELTREWAPETVLFRISGRVLPMHLDWSGAVPGEVTRIWEREWGIAYAGRVRFEAPPDAPTKWLNAREDLLPAPPTVTRLEGKAAILDAVALALTQRDEDLFAKSAAAGEERRKEDAVQGVSHGGRWTKKAESFRWSAPNDIEEDYPGKVPIWPPMEAP